MVVLQVDTILHMCWQPFEPFPAGDMQSCGSFRVSTSSTRRRGLTRVSHQDIQIVPYERGVREHQD